MINIYVGNLPYSTDEQELEQLFSQFGSVAKSAIIMDRETGRSRGFGFVEMHDPEEGRKAIEALNGSDYQGRNLTINEARPRQERPGGGYSRPTGGGYSGGPGKRDRYEQRSGGYSGGSGGYSSGSGSSESGSSGYSNQRFGE